MERLPLFPLGTVLVPGAPLPLQIFEQRYVILLRDLLAGRDERPPVFGVVAIREGFEVGVDGVRALHPVGCAAELAQAADIGEHRYFIVARGTRRFRLVGVAAEVETPYVTAEVEWLDEGLGDEATAARLAAALRTELVEHGRSADGETPDPPSDPRELSWWVAHRVRLDLPERQRLLEADNTESRLRLELSILRRERELARTLGAVAAPPEPPLNLN